MWIVCARTRNTVGLGFKLVEELTLSGVFQINTFVQLAFHDNVVATWSWPLLLFCSVSDLVQEAISAEATIDLLIEY